jgi:hypothetical protein
MTKFDYLTSQTFDLNDWRAVDDLLRTGNQSQQSQILSDLTSHNNPLLLLRTMFAKRKNSACTLNEMHSQNYTDIFLPSLK